MNIQELEALFGEIDERALVEPVEVSVAGATESTGSLSVSAARRVARGFPWDSASPGAVARDGTREETLLDLDLSNVDIPDEYVESKVRAAFSDRGKAGALPGVKVMQLGASANYEVVEDYTYHADGGYSITALSGFTYDRASIPRIFWVIIDKDALSNVPPLFHDLLYSNGGRLPEHQVSPYRTFQREEADGLFFELMEKSGVKGWRATLAYQAVSNFARRHWRG